MDLPHSIAQPKAASRLKRIIVPFHEALDFSRGKNFPRCSAIAA
jgi:hypothetical protein